MLCDDLLANTADLLEVYDGLDRVYAKVRNAQKFVLTREFSIAADGLVDNIPELCKVVPYCRIPFPVTWIEWVHDDRPHWDWQGPHKARPIDPSRHQHAPHRCGFLLEQRGPSAASWKAHLFWSMKDKPDGGAGQYNGSLGAIIIDTARADGAADPLMAALADRALADFGRQMIANLMQTEPRIVQRLGEYALEDWGGEMRFMIAVLGLLNTRNVAQTQTVDNEAYNAKRIKRGARPLFSHTLLRVRPQLYVRAGDNKPIAQQHVELRFHLCRGHFKHRKTGLFWWSMHARGSRKQGVVHKDYELEG